MLKRAVILILFLGFFLISLENVSAVISCGSQTYPDGTGYCCDQGNGANGVWFRGDYYSSCPSGTFRYVSNSGNDANTGLTPTTAWRTVEKANTAASGEVVIFLGGTYNENNADCESTGVNFQPTSSGTPGNPTIYKGHPDYLRPVIKGIDNGPANSVVADDGHYYNRPACLFASSVTIDHLEFANAYCGFRLVGNNLILQDNVVHDIPFRSGAGENCAGMTFLYTPSSNVTIRGNEYYNILNSVSGAGDGVGAGMIVYRTKDSLFEDNYFHNSGAGIEFKNQVTNSTIRRNVFENLNVWGIVHQCTSVGGGFVWPGGNNDIYENIFYNASNDPGNQAAISLWHSGEPDGCNGYPYENVRIFNNVLYQGIGSGLQIWADSSISPTFTFENFSVLNNIFVNFEGAGRYENVGLWDPELLTNFRSDNNLFYDASEDDILFYSRPLMIWYNLSEWKTASISSPVGAQDQNSKQLNPNFLSTNPSSPDFLKPNATSPAIDAGVKVSGYHCDTSGGTTPAGCKVWYGLAPDIGAYEYNPGLPTITCTTVDVNDDLKINIVDLALVSYWQGTPVTSNYQHLDVNADGSINFGDVNEVLMRVGQNC
jgi:hypothetical protein